jgi:hypothetical protein
VTPGESSARVRDRVLAARARQLARLKRWDLDCNAEMPASVMRECCRLDDAGESLLAKLVEERGSLSARSIDRLLKVARTIADLIGHEDITHGDLVEAAGFRAVDPSTELSIPAVGGGPKMFAIPRWPVVQHAPARSAAAAPQLADSDTDVSAASVTPPSMSADPPASPVSAEPPPSPTSAQPPPSPTGAESPPSPTSAQSPLSPTSAELPPSRASAVPSPPSINTESPPTFRNAGVPS